MDIIKSLPQLHGEARRISSLDATSIDAMFTLFNKYYLNTTIESFQRDLSNKNWCILLYSVMAKTLQGFTTLHFYKSEFEGKTLGVVYSGDTIIDKDYWGSPILPKIWIKTVLKVGKKYPKPLYWLLISSGYRTYRFLPIFYKNYYPNYNNPTPPKIQKLINKLASERFGKEYHPKLGIVRFLYGSTPLVNGIGDVTNKRLKNPHIRFFVKVNPGHISGNELVCLTQIDESNLTKAGSRMLL